MTMKTPKINYSILPNDFKSKNSFNDTLLEMNIQTIIESSTAINCPQSVFRAV